MHRSSRTGRRSRPAGEAARARSGATVASTLGRRGRSRRWPWHRGSRCRGRHGRCRGHGHPPGFHGYSFCTGTEAGGTKGVIPMTFPALNHVALTVRDLSVSVPWYEDLFDADAVLDEDTDPDM